MNFDVHKAACCRYWQTCKYSGTDECPNLISGCFLLNVSFTAEAEKL